MKTHKLFNIGINNLPDPKVDELFNDLTLGYKIISAVSIGAGVQYVLQKETETVEPSSIPCYVDCDITGNPKECHEELEKEGKCNKYQDRHYHYHL